MKALAISAAVRKVGYGKRIADLHHYLETVDVVELYPKHTSGVFGHLR